LVMTTAPQTLAFALILVRIARITWMRPIATDTARCVVSVSEWIVSVCVGHTGELCKTEEPIEVLFGVRLTWAKGTTC